MRGGRGGRGGGGGGEGRGGGEGGDAGEGTGGVAGGGGGGAAESQVGYCSKFCWPRCGKDLPTLHPKRVSADVFRGAHVSCGPGLKFPLMLEGRAGNIRPAGQMRRSSLSRCEPRCKYLKLHMRVALSWLTVQQYTAQTCG